MGSAFVDSEPACFSVRVLFDPEESSSFQLFKLTSKTEPSSSKLSVVVSFVSCNDSPIQRLNKAVFVEKILAHSNYKPT